MFRLEKLEISGFKSFADRTSVVFGEGITAIVGPNGCGKSNVAEAISWVLGEQSAKNLRGGKMEDVIFNGTRDRKPTGMAEVTLTMVAVEDIAARDGDEQEKDDEAEYETAVSNAERAAVAARSLVEEMTRTEDATDTQPPQVDGQPQEDQPPATDNGQRTTDKRPVRRQKRKKVAISAGERITVGRRLYRTGDSDYLMNGRPCLLRDIQDLFAGTGLGGAHYAIIEQGRIGQILSSKPLDRRALIEEAAGITKFKSRKRATELKLESAKQNLTRLNDIITEIERQVNSLKRQAQKARRYRRLREELRAIQKVVFTADYHRLTAAHERVLAELEEAERQHREIVAQVAGRESEHQLVSGNSREAEDSLAALKEKAAAIELEADRARNRRAFDEQQIKELTARIGELERDQKALEERLASLEAETSKRAEDLKALEAELAAEQSALSQRDGEYQQELLLLRQAENEIEQLRQRMLTEIGAVERLRNLSASLEDSLRRLDLKQSNLKSEMERAQARLQEATGEYERVGDEAEGNRARLAELTRQMAERAAALEATRNETIELRSQLEVARVEGAAARHRLASLEDLDKHHAYYSDAVQQVMSPDQAARISAIGTLADFVEVEAQYERLIESLFSRELQCVLVPTIDDGLAGLDYLKSSDLGRGAFLVVGLHGGEGDPAEDEGEQGRKGEREKESSAHPFIPSPLHPFTPSPLHLEVLRAVDLLGLRPEIRSVVERAFPDKCAAAVVPDIEAALHLSLENPSRVYVTLAGEQVVNGRLIVSGAPAGQKGTSLLALKREIKQLQAQAQTLVEEEEKITTALAQATARLQGIESEAQGLDLEARQQEKVAAARDSQLEALARDLERARQHVRVVESEQELTAQEREELAARLEKLGEELADAETSLATVKGAVAEAQAQALAMRGHVEELAEQLSACRAQAAARAERLQAARAEARRMENEAEELRSRLNRNRLELYENHNRIEQLAASLSEGHSAAAAFDLSGSEIAKEIGAAAEAVASARARVDELEAALREMRQQQAETQERRSHLEVERARIESEAEHLARTCFAELAMRLEDVVTSVELGQAVSLEQGSKVVDVESEISNLESEIADSVNAPLLPSDLDAARARMDELRVKLDDLGPVNMMALEELEEAERRFQFLSEQRRDILDSIRLTEEALSEIKRRSRERFRHAFTHINQNFQHMFVELFGGGRGEMALIDEQDVLESGIDLIAQPPGKRLQNVLLLSGGEKAMAAIALVLAIFQYRPSPFCILDEVDAPLDEMNVGRFSDKVIEMSRDTQFLVITHNKRTMEAARALYGVTMEELGVSKLVSVRFE